MSLAPAVVPAEGTAAKLENPSSNLEHALAEEARRCDVLSRLPLALAAAGSLEGVLQATIDAGVELTGADFGLIACAAGTDGEPTLAAAGAPRDGLGPWLAGAATRLGDTVLRSDDVAADPRFGDSGLLPAWPAEAPPMRACLALSVVAHSGEVLGQLLFGHAQPAMFSERLEGLVVGLAAQAAAAIETARLRAETARAADGRVRAEAALAESESRFHMIADRAPLICWMMEADGSVVWCNRRWYDYTGATPEETLGFGWRKYHDSAVLAEVSRRWRQAIAAGSAFDMMLPIRGADGAFRPFLSRVEPSFDVDGRRTGWFGAAVDVSAETAARERLQFTLAAGRLGSWELDVPTRTYDASEICKANYGRAADAPFSFDDLVAAIHPADRERMLGAMATAMRTGSDYDIEYRVVHPNGEVRWIQARGRADRTAGQDGVRRIAGVSLDVTERKRGEERQRLLLNELNHRVKNTLATVQSIASNTLRSSRDAAAFRDAFEARLMALSQTHNLLTDQNWEAAGLHDILRLELKPHAGGRADGGARLHIVSDRDVRLNAKAAVSLGMAIHELATNAVKYGALSAPAGRVSVATQVQPGPDGDDLVLEWVETGGPPVEPPRRRGFGGRVLEKGLAGELGGEVRLDYRPAGLVCRMRLPMHALEPEK